MRTEKICVAPGEVGGINGGDFAVGATKQEIIYLYHIDSCAGVILAAASPLADDCVVVGAHMGMGWGKDFHFNASGLATYAPRLIKALSEKVKGADAGAFSHAFFVGDESDWGQFRTALCKGLKIPDSEFVDLATTDAYGFATGGEVQVLTAKWVGRPTPLFGRPPTDVGGRHSSKSLTGKGHI